MIKKIIYKDFLIFMTYIHFLVSIFVLRSFYYFYYERKNDENKMLIYGIGIVLIIIDFIISLQFIINCYNNKIHLLIIM